jgi:glutamyl/glutaminyl-tRNA synthetase
MPTMCGLRRRGYTPESIQLFAERIGVTKERVFKIGREVWIEREDFEEVPPKGYKRLFPGNIVRLKGGYVIECTGVGAKDADGRSPKCTPRSLPTPRAAPPAPTA